MKTDETLNCFRTVRIEGNTVVCLVRDKRTYDVLYEDRVSFTDHDSAWAFASAYRLGEPFDLNARFVLPQGPRRASLWDALTTVCEEVRDADILGEVDPTTVVQRRRIEH